jgi:MscS family membrane protein
MALLLVVMLVGGAWGQGDNLDPDREEKASPAFEHEHSSGIAGILGQLAEPDESAQALHELLQPANTNSPRDTVISFFTLTQRYYDLLRQDTYTREDAAELQHVYGEMEQFFDLRSVAPSLRQDVAVNAAVYLREVIDRIGLPPVEEIPDREQMLAAVQEGHPPSWKVGNSPLEIVRMGEGASQGKYLFSEETLGAVQDLFWQIRSFPYRTLAAQGFYEASFLTPNPTLQSWTNRLPAWMYNNIQGQTIWQWIAMILLFVLAILSIWLVWSGLKRLMRNVTPLARDATLLLVPLFAAFVSYMLYDLIGDKIFITGLVFQGAVYVMYGVALAAVIIFIFSLGTVLIDLSASTEYAKRRPSEIHLLALGIRVASIVAIVAVLLQGMYLMGFSLATILAGAGVTGLAVALAAQNTLKNVFGSLMLLLDRPFEVGQRIKTRGYDGIVEDIGMRSTRLRLLTGHLVSIPNENLASMDIENVDLRPSIKRTIDLSLPADTPLDKVQRAIATLQDVLAAPSATDAAVAGEPSTKRGAAKAHPNEAINHPDRPPRVYFNEINAESLNINVTYWYRPPDYDAYLEHSQMINEEIIRRFRSEGIPANGIGTA